MNGNEKSYVLGMVCADGSLGRRVRGGEPSYVGFYSTDKEWLEQIRDVVDLSRPVFPSHKP